MFREKNKKENLNQEEENSVIEFFTDPVYAYSSLYGIDHQEENQPATPEEQKK